MDELNTTFKYFFRQVMLIARDTSFSSLGLKGIKSVVVRDLAGVQKACNMIGGSPSFPSYSMVGVNKTTFDSLLRAARKEGKGGEFKCHVFLYSLLRVLLLIFASASPTDYVNPILFPTFSLLLRNIYNPR